jgi:hypothetical protein
LWSCDSDLNVVVMDKWQNIASHFVAEMPYVPASIGKTCVAIALAFAPASAWSCVIVAAMGEGKPNVVDTMQWYMSGSQVLV